MDKDVYKCWIKLYGSSRSQRHRAAVNGYLVEIYRVMIAENAGGEALKILDADIDRISTKNTLFNIKNTLNIITNFLRKEKYNILGDCIEYELMHGDVFGPFVVVQIVLDEDDEEELLKSPTVEELEDSVRCFFEIKFTEISKMGSLDSRCLFCELAHSDLVNVLDKNEKNSVLIGKTSLKSLEKNALNNVLEKDDLAQDVLIKDDLGNVNDKNMEEGVLEKNVLVDALEKNALVNALDESDLGNEEDESEGEIVVDFQI